MGKKNYQMDRNCEFFRYKFNINYLLLTVLLVVLSGCPTHRLPQLLSDSEQMRAKSGLVKFLSNNSRILTEAGISEPTEFSVGAKQTNEILPYECWELQINDPKRHPVRLLLKIYSNDEDALTEEINYRKLRTLKMPVPVDLVWSKAKPYANAPCVLMAKPVGRTLGEAIALKISKKEPETAQNYTDLIKILADLHRTTLLDTVDRFPVGEWLRQMAEIGVYREIWDQTVCDSLKAIASGWKPERKANIHGALSFQNVWVDSSFKVTVYTDWERSGCGEPIIDVGFLAAEMMVAQPLELRERYNQAFDPDFDRIGLTKAFLGAYLKQTGIPNTAELQANFRASFYLKLVSIVIYQQRDPLLKRGVEQIRSMLSVLLRNDPTQKLVNLSGK